ncbi:hypothetical protein Ocin01_00104 [Orchesella cincta]|uniref:Transmembrane protein n=1 Tax=Orchesella cincta TaxID=48709 RepID=A0A1D2NMN6_ORCCI|nr:hypothetical protein Ocin01_00104 [Orchesella cincta]
MFNFLKCGTGSYHHAAMTVAIIDVIFTAILLILFVLGSSFMVAFEFVGSDKNATRVLDEITDDVFGTRQGVYNSVRQRKDIAEDMGVWLIIMFLTLVDFIISCIFLDGVKSKNPNKCQVWFNIRVVIVVVFKIVVFINVVYGTNWYRCIPDLILTIYRIVGLLIGYAFLKEIRAIYTCRNCNASNNLAARNEAINLSWRRKEVQKAMMEAPIVTVTEPQDPPLTGSAKPTPTPSPVLAPRKNSPTIQQNLGAAIVKKENKI